MSTTIPQASPSQTASPFSGDLAYDDASPLDDSTNQQVWAIFAILVMCLTLGYWNMFEYTANFWQKDLYSHGWIVPIFSVFLLFARANRESGMTSTELLVSWIVGGACLLTVASAALSEDAYPYYVTMPAVLVLIGLVFYHLRTVRLTEVSPAIRWSGVAVILVGFLIRLLAAYYDMNPLDRYSFIVALLGICVLVGGLELLSWAGLPIAFVVFMFPLPTILENSVLMTLQKWAAMWGTWTLQLLGAPAMRDGHKLIVDQMPLDVAAACSGLRMATIFGAMSIAMAILMVERPWWDRLIMIISAVPVALLTNVIRITITALLLLYFHDVEGLDKAIHDYAGYAMMPIAMGILWLELEILRKISVEVDTEDYAAFGTINS